MGLILFAFLFFIWFNLKNKKERKNSDQIREVFWKREQEANFVRPKDISSLDYIDIPLEILPFQDKPKEAVAFVQDKIRSLSKEKILNLNGLSNTDIKYTYGAQNLEILSACDQRYLLLLQTLNTWASLVYEDGDHKKAKNILEYAVYLKSDISTTYSLLAKIYSEEGNSEKIKNLIHCVQELNTLLKDTIIKNLQSFI